MPLPLDPTQADPAMAAAVQEGIMLSDEPDEEQRKIQQAEEDAVKALMREYECDRELDKTFRQQVVVDRRYAAGTQDLTWAVNTNLIGGMIDVLVSFLYARNPDVSIKKNANVSNAGTQEGDDFARTAQLTISDLWKKSLLKRNARKMVRSALGTGEGWLKCTMVCDSPVTPEMQNEMNDLRENLRQLEAIKARAADPEAPVKSPEEVNAEMQRQSELLASLEQRMEATVRKYFAVDFLPTESVQVSSDVPGTEDHLDANWNSNYIHIRKGEIKEKFPRLTDKDIQTATTYFQKTPSKNQPALRGVNNVDAADADQYVSSEAGAGRGGGDKSTEFVRVIEFWDRRTGHVKTVIDGVKRWAKEPFQPPYPSTRFYPYFRLAFYEVDGERHPQSLSWRLSKLQDEYATSRSNFRLARERSIPGVFVNGQQISPDQMKKIIEGVVGEYTVIQPTDPTAPLSNAFAEKPVGKYDPRIYENGPILMDMEKMAGVQEALQTSNVTPKTATEASIQQSGFASRTTADRDAIEVMLTDMAQYTLEQSLTALTIQDVQRICGSSALWPAGMALDDLLTMAEVAIVAGTTGKPKADQDKMVWGTILPQLVALIPQIQAAQMMGNEPLVKALTELLRETMIRMGDDTDIDRFIPQLPTTPAMPGAPVPGAAPPTGEAPSSAPTGAPTGSGAPPLENPTLENPTVTQPPV